MYQLTITADDLGYGVPRDNGIMQCYKSGAVTQGTVLINGASAKYAITHAKQLGMPLGKYILTVLHNNNNNNHNNAFDYIFCCNIYKKQTFSGLNSSFVLRIHLSIF